MECPTWIRSKEGMVPFVELNGEEIPDSGLIISRLCRAFPDKDTEANLTAAEKGHSRALEALVEVSILPSVARIRYQVSEGVQKIDMIFQVSEGVQKIDMI